MLDKHKSVHSTYFSDYLEYSLIALEDAVLGSEGKLFETGIKNRRINYGNLAYMNFFTQFYQQRFIQISQGKDGFELLSAVNGTQDYPKLLKIAAANKFIDNDTLAELFIINGLREVYEDKTFKKNKVLQMLKIIEGRALNRKNKKIAAAVYDELSSFNTGMPAPDFSLFDNQNKLYHLSNFTKAPLLICFWSAGSNSSLRQLSFLSDFHEKYGNQLTVLGICIDDESLKAEKHLSSIQAKWLNLYKDKQYDVTDKYRVYSVPTYVLINDKSQIVKYPASGPEDGLEAEINRLFSE
jgi:peroxiredoxin